MDIIAEIRRRHFIENETITSLTEAFKLSRPSIREHFKTVELGGVVQTIKVAYFRLAYNVRCSW